MSRSTKENYEKALLVAGEHMRRNETLEQALKRCYGSASKSLYSQARLALYGLGDYVGGERGFQLMLSSMKASEVNERDVTGATASWYSEGLSPATINKRLNCLSKMGVSVEGLRVKDPKKLKWYLKESERHIIIEACRHEAHYQAHQTFFILADLIEWTTRTGLRIEESLRLRWADFGDKFSQVSVRGTKTASSQATLPLGSEVAALLVHTRHNRPRGDLVFPSTYLDLQNAWDYIRNAYGWKDDPTATLKALRRSAARYLHVDCNMPLHMVQQYLRHESMDTTLEYLRLTGGYGTEEMRRYLK